MLGENHSLLNEFPEFNDTIESLKQSNSAFADEVKRYDLLDAEIRKLELRDSPIADDEMLALKNQRAESKDDLYQQLKNA
ncbi:YdcH family protein [Motiliproteus sediminis]|uniref:YdcH family protein n=1 Tax=Motiliproteus sediminis TaxID=1468178 RepID=UPI001AEF3ABD|nr:DUF465 domain-containing protein [Motiliproteus sediminis]